MHKKIFPTPAIERKHRQGLLGAHFDCFLNWMQEHGYSRHSMRFNVQCLTHLGEYLKKKGISSIHQLQGADGQELLVTYRDYCRGQGYWRRESGLKLYLGALEETGILSSSTPGNSLLFHETKQYRDFLKNQRGLAEKTIHRHIYWIEKFLRFLGCQEHRSSVPTFGIGQVDRFIEQEAERLGRTSQGPLAGCLRSFLRFLYQSGKLATDLSVLITSPRCYKLESLPRVLDWDEVQKIVNSVHRSTRNGPQYYAILVLLTTYGLRAGEVAQLKLEDIDWRRKAIHIVPRKSGKDLYLPLTHGVAQAILDYLRHRRFPSKYRQVFLLTRAPWRSLTRQNIAYVVNRHIELAGLELPRGGPHLLRHSFATHLIRKGASLKQIGDLLGHRALESTHIYTKTATEHLREVALEVPEVK